MDEYDVLIEAVSPLYTIVSVVTDSEESARIAAVARCKKLPLAAWEFECPISSQDPLRKATELLVLEVLLVEEGLRDPLERRAYEAWTQFCMSGEKPDGIPCRPDIAYREQGWVSWCDWLGWSTSGTTSNVRGPHWCGASGKAVETVQ